MQNFYFCCTLCTNYKASLASEYNASQHLVTHHMAKDVHNLSWFVRDCKFVWTLCGSLGSSFYKLLAQLRAQVVKMTDLENGIKILDIMDLFLLPITDGFDAQANSILAGCPVRNAFPITSGIVDIPVISSIIPAIRYQAADCATFPDGYFGTYDPRISLEDGDSVLPPVPSGLLPLQTSVPQTSVQPNLPSADHAASLSSIADVDAYMLKKEAILKSRTDFLFRKLKKLNDGVLKRTALLDLRERRLIEDRTAFEEYMLSQQQSLASEDMASSAYLSEQLNDTLSMTYGTFSSGK